MCRVGLASGFGGGLRLRIGGGIGGFHGYPDG